MSSEPTLMLSLQLADNPEYILNAWGFPHALAEHPGGAGNSQWMQNFSFFIPAFELKLFDEMGR